MAMEKVGYMAAAALALTMIDSASVRAQDATELDASEPKWLDAISVTATRNPIKAFEYPGMVTLVGQEQLQVLQPSSPDDVLRFVPNVEFTGGPRRTGEVPSIRGFSGPDVIVLFDGARQNFNGAHDGRFFIDPSLLREVEVLHGSASSLYGSGGMGGVIEFRTFDAASLLGEDETFGGRVSAGYQSVNYERLATFSAYGTPGENVDLLASITKRDSKTIDLGDGTELDQTDDDIFSGLAKASYQFADHHRVEGSFITFDNTAQEPNVGQGGGDDDTVEKDIRSDTYRVVYNYDNPDNPLIDLDFSAYYTDFQADELRLDDLGAGPAGELLKRDVNTIGLRLDNRSHFMLGDMMDATITYGGEAYRDEQDGAADAGERDGVPDAEADFYGLFSQAEILASDPFGQLPGDLLIIPGLRYDDYSSSSSIADENAESEFSPRIGVTYLPNEWLSVFGNYAHAFRAPSFDELFLNGVHFEIPVGAGVVNRFVSNPDLAPQKTRTVEFGGGLSFDSLAEPRDQFQVKASHFLIWGDNFIDLQVIQPELFIDCNPFIPGNCDGTTTAVNVPNAKLWGSEIEASYESSRFIVTAGFSRIDGENEDTGEKLGVLTPDEFTLITGVKLPEINSIVGWRMLAADQFDETDDPAEERDGYAVHDFYFAWAPREGAAKGLRVDLGIDNAFDKDYSRVFNDVAEPGRNFKILVGFSQGW